MKSRLVTQGKKTAVHALLYEVGGNTSAGRVHPARHGDRLAYHPQAPSYPRQNSLHTALREVGRIERLLSCWTG